MPEPQFLFLVYTVDPTVSTHYQQLVYSQTFDNPLPREWCDLIRDYEASSVILTLPINALLLTAVADGSPLTKTHLSRRRSAA
jgi:hypothetical protein